PTARATARASTCAPAPPPSCRLSSRSRRTRSESRVTPSRSAWSTSRHTLMTMEDLSREIILDHYQNPRNHGRLEQPTVANRGYNPLCGDEIELSIGIDEG